MTVEITTIGSFILFSKKIPNRTLYILKYNNEHFSTQEFRFLDKDEAIAFAERKIKTDKRLFF